MWFQDPDIVSYSRFAGNGLHEKAFCAVEPMATGEVLNRPGAEELAKAGDAVVVPKQAGAQGFYKVLVSDAPMEAE